MAAIEIAVIYNVNILFIRIIESIFLALAVLNGIRHFYYVLIIKLKRQQVMESWLKYHSDLTGLDQLIFTKRLLNDMIYLVSDSKDGLKLSEREKSIYEYYPQIGNAISEVHSLYEQNIISNQTMIAICKNTINSINNAFDLKKFEPEYLDVTIPNEIRNFVNAHAEQPASQSIE